MQRSTYIPGKDLPKLYVYALQNFPRLRDYEHPFVELVNSIHTKVKTQTNNVNKLIRQVGVVLGYLKILCSETERCPDVYPINIGDINRLKGTLNQLRNEVRDLPTNKKQKNFTYARIERQLGPSLDEVMEMVDACENVSAGLCHTLYEHTDLTVETPQQPDKPIPDQDGEY